MNQVVKFETIEFHGKELKALSYNGTPYVAMKPLVESMGLLWEGQRQRIQRDTVLNSTTSSLKVVAEDGKTREMLCLPVDMLNGWLFGINENQVNPTIKEIILTYKRECYRVLFEHFNKPQINPLSAKDQYILGVVKAKTEEERLAVVRQYELDYVAPLEDKVVELTPKAEYHDKVLRSDGLYTATEIAKDLGMGVQKFNKWLETVNVQYKVNGSWVLKAYYQDKGYTHTYTGESESGCIYNQTRWTEKGREFLYRLHQKKGVPDD